MTLGRGSAAPPAVETNGMCVSFELSELAVTPYFAVALAIGDVAVEFVIAADLVDPPPVARTGPVGAPGSIVPT